MNSLILKIMGKRISIYILVMFITLIFIQCSEMMVNQVPVKENQKEINNLVSLNKIGSVKRIKPDTIYYDKGKKIRLEDLPYILHKMNPEEIREWKTKTAFQLNQCGIRDTYYWAVTKYTPLKTLGIMTPYDLNYWTQLREDYGFSQLYISDLYASRSAGFSDNQVIYGLSGNTYFELITSALMHPSVGGYFIDEPIEGGISLANLLNIASDIYNLLGGKPLFVSSYYNGDANYTSFANNSPNGYIQCDKYWNNIFEPSISQYWNNFKIYYGSKNISNWIHIDHQNPGSGPTDWNTLFNIANESGLSSVMLYAPSVGDSKINSFCYSAWTKGWLHGWAEHIMIVWKCDLPQPCDCNNPEHENDWYIYQIIRYHDYWEVYP